MKVYVTIESPVLAKLVYRNQLRDTAMAAFSLRRRPSYMNRI